MQKDLDPTTEVNERLQEHYQRVWMARQYFAGSAYPWDRRGEVYLRYGEPDYRSRSGRAPGVMSVAVQRVKDELYAQLYTRSSQGCAGGHGVSRAKFACDVCRFVWDDDGKKMTRILTRYGRWLFAGYLCGR